MKKINVHTRVLVQSATLHCSCFVIAWTAFKAELKYFKARQVWERERQRQREKEDILQKLLTMNNTVPQFSKSSLCNPLQILDYSQQQRSSKCRPSSSTENHHESLSWITTRDINTTISITRARCLEIRSSFSWWKLNYKNMN